MNRDTEPGCLNPPVVYQIMHNPLCPVNRYGKSYSLGPRINRCINAYEFAIDVQEGTTAIARVDRGVYLDKIVINTGFCPYRSVEGAYHPCCNCVRQAKRITNCNDCFSYHKVI